MADEMDYQFPQQLFPTFFNCGPPDSAVKHNTGNWGSYDRVRIQGGTGPLSSWKFTSRHQVSGKTWHHTEPVPVPFLSPKNALLSPSTPPDPMDFVEHMQNFFMDHYQEAFGCMGEILGNNFNFIPGVRKMSFRPQDYNVNKYEKDSVNMWRVKRFLDTLKFKRCQLTYSSETLDAYSALLSDVVHTVPLELLGTLLYEELSEQRDRSLFSEGATGGALAFVPLEQSGSSSSQVGCLLYPGNKGLTCLNFHRVELQHHRGSTSCVDASSKPFSFQLKGPVRQICSASLFNQCCVAVRSDHLCGVWRFSEIEKPRLLQVVNTRELATCVNVSPHVLGEVLVVSESGTAKLWTVGRGMQTVREENQNLYFNDKSSWRWCEFSAHPRVMLYADRTGVELTDMRVKPTLGHTLFRISKSAECRNGERLILSRYLGNAHSFHHLITTQYSAYIMDERFPSVPMLKRDHMMESPPMFCHIITGHDSEVATTKVLLGAHSSQEITLLQYGGGRVEACFSQGPPQSLHRPRDSLKHLPVQLPRRQDVANNRLSSPAAGLTCIQKKKLGEECICILQLTEAGDIFYQILEPKRPDTSGPPRSEDGAQLQPTQKKVKGAGRTPSKWLKSASQQAVFDTSSNEAIIAQTHDITAQVFVAETPEKEQELDMSSDFSSDESKKPKSQHLKKLEQQVIVNSTERENVSGVDTGVKDRKVYVNNADTEEYDNLGENINMGQGTLLKISDNTLIIWKRWLQKLMQKSHAKRPKGAAQHKMVNSKGLLYISDDNDDDEVRDPTVEDSVQDLRRDLRACMAKRSLLLHSNISSSHGASDVMPFPNEVDTEVWKDQLSQRLTVSWKGEEAWRAWWKEELGLNREEKMESLKRKRRREKEAKRATGRRLALSGSFTSSVSNLSELDDFSDSTGWSSVASQGVWSDIGSMDSQHWRPRPTEPCTMQEDTQDSVLPATPQSVKEKRGNQQSTSSSSALFHSESSKPESIPTSQRKTKRAVVEDYLNSLFAPQNDPSENDFLEEENTMQLPLPHATATLQVHSSQSVPQSLPGVNLSQESSARSSFSQFSSQGHSSQGHRGLSQLSQLSQTKKKSRMGF